MCKVEARVVVFKEKKGLCSKRSTSYSVQVDARVFKWKRGLCSSSAPRPALSRHTKGLQNKRNARDLSSAPKMVSSRQAKGKVGIF